MIWCSYINSKNVLRLCKDCFHTVSVWQHQIPISSLLLGLAHQKTDGGSKEEKPTTAVQQFLIYCRAPQLTKTLKSPDKFFLRHCYYSINFALLLLVFYELLTFLSEETMQQMR